MKMFFNFNVNNLQILASVSFFNDFEYTLIYIVINKIININSNKITIRKKEI